MATVEPLTRAVIRMLTCAVPSARARRSAGDTGHVMRTRGGVPATPDRVHAVPFRAAVPRAVATPPSVYRGRGPIDPTPAPTRSHTLKVLESAPAVIPA